KVARRKNQPPHVACYLVVRIPTRSHALPVRRVGGGLGCSGGAVASRASRRIRPRSSSGQRRGGRTRSCLSCFVSLLVPHARARDDRTARRMFMRHIVPLSAWTTTTTLMPPCSVPAIGNAVEE